MRTASTSKVYHIDGCIGKGCWYNAVENVGLHEGMEIKRTPSCSISHPCIPALLHPFETLFDRCSANGAQSCNCYATQTPLHARLPPENGKQLMGTFRGSYHLFIVCVCLSRIDSMQYIYQGINNITNWLLIETTKKKRPICRPRLCGQKQPSNDLVPQPFFNSRSSLFQSPSSLLNSFSSLSRGPSFLGGSSCMV